MEDELPSEVRKSLNIFYHFGQSGRNELNHFLYINVRSDIDMLIYKITNKINNKCYIG